MRHVPVDVASGRYEAVVGDGARHGLAALIAARRPRCRAVAIVTQQRLVDEGWLEGVDPGVDASLHVIGEGEGAKTLATIERLCGELVDEGVSRGDVVVGFGGGVVCDVAGFVAAVHLRGVALVQVPSTLLGQVDAAIGGKNGVNLTAGKNLVGTIHQPLGVLCDTALLATLPVREWASGRGEVVKYALLTGEEPATLAATAVGELVARCVEVKAGFLADDELDTGRRALLNYGHTLAHALETTQAPLGDASLRHGEAVAVGLAFAARLAARLGRIGADRVADHDEALEVFGLDGALPTPCSAAELCEVMRRDKKATHDLTFVLDGPSGIEVVDGIDERDVVATLRAMGATT
ncbi:MAG TPA: 3-dehydroquinate synthase family protein [Acidimicrobiales bacterium]|nr:3-dehydroquinate synthase family protein [Acidimicrobiales bacterium]